MLEVEYCFKLHPGSTNNIRKSNNKDTPQGDKNLLHWSHRHVPVSVMSYVFDSSLMAGTNFSTTRGVRRNLSLKAKISLGIISCLTGGLALEGRPYNQAFTTGFDQPPITGEGGGY